MFQASAFKTSEGEARFLAAYDNEMKSWPVPYEQVDLRSRFGTTHVVVCGPKTAPPTVHRARPDHGPAANTSLSELVLSLARIHGSRLRERARNDVSRLEVFSDAVRNGACHARRRLG